MAAHTLSHLSCCAVEAGKANDGTGKNEEKENVYEQRRLFVEQRLLLQCTGVCGCRVGVGSYAMVTWMDEICFTQANVSGVTDATFNRNVCFCVWWGWSSVTWKSHWILMCVALPLRLRSHFQIPGASFRKQSAGSIIKLYLLPKVKKWCLSKINLIWKTARLHLSVNHTVLLEVCVWGQEDMWGHKDTPFTCLLSTVNGRCKAPHDCWRLMQWPPLTNGT